MGERERGQRFGEPRQLMVMRCEEATAFVHLMHRLDHRPGERKPVIGRGAAPDLVQYDEALRGRLREDRRGLDHLDHEGRAPAREIVARRSEEHTSELQSLMRISYAVFCLKKKRTTKQLYTHPHFNAKQNT